MTIYHQTLEHHNIEQLPCKLFYMPGFVQFLHIKMVQPWKAEEVLQSDGMNLNEKHNNQY
jgi:hypothetical protein